jgi:cytoplasmic iron level regulating protein YaaA (DUF328/UPF0246 family)
MRRSVPHSAPLRAPELIDEAIALNTQLKRLTVPELMSMMHISEPLAKKTLATISAWTAEPSMQSAAVDSFLGDIYSGLQPGSWLDADRAYADDHLRIISGLYGILRPLDGIYPYRLEMGYKLLYAKTASLYDFWSDAIAKTLPQAGPIVNLSSLEYSKVVLPFLDATRIITPSFLTISPKTKQPVFVAVHSKIARGSFARWLISTRYETADHFSEFHEIGYVYNESLSTAKEPVYIAKVFAGKGLSIRLHPGLLY